MCPMKEENARRNAEWRRLRAQWTDDSKKRGTILGWSGAHLARRKDYKAKTPKDFLAI